MLFNPNTMLLLGFKCNRFFVYRNGVQRRVGAYIYHKPSGISPRIGIIPIIPIRYYNNISSFCIKVVLRVKKVILC